MSTAKAPIAVATCSSTAQEVRECCQQLGLPTRIYSNRPACLFAEAPDLLEPILDRAGRQHSGLLLAFGACCGGMRELAREYNAGAVSVSHCADLLMGAGTCRWCSQHGVLLLPPAYFSTWLPRLRRDRALAASVISRARAPGVQQIAAIDEAGRPTDRKGMAEIEELAGRRTDGIYTGLGHIREALRAAAQEARLPLFSLYPAPIDPRTLGPGDDCLLVTSRAEAGTRSGLRMISDSVQRGLKSTWVVGDRPGVDFAGGGEGQARRLRVWQETGELQVRSREALLEDSAATTSPQQLVEYWVARSLEALQEGRDGIAVMHGDGWAETPGLSTEFLLEYSARLSAACSEWPILAAWQVSPGSWAHSALQELGRTHPLRWTDGKVAATMDFVPTDDYLGGQVTLESLAAGTQSVDCPALAALVSAVADGELDADHSSAIASHVDGCPACAHDVRDWRELRQALRSLAGQETPLPEDLWARVRRAMDNEGQ